MLTHYGDDLTFPAPADDPTVTVVVTLGHDGLTVPVDDARRILVTSVLPYLPTVLARFRDGTGVWDGGTEACDAWIVSGPLSNVSILRDSVLPAVATRLGQESIGFIVHDGDVADDSFVAAADR